MRGCASFPGPGGFTLIEMMVVLTIIGTLALLVGPSLLRNVSDANVTAAKTQIEIFTVALDAYRLDTGEYPSTAQGLAILWEVPAPADSTTPAPTAWRGPYLRKPVPKDPWGREYLYHYPGSRQPDTYDLYTLGRDGVIGGEGERADITSWGGPPLPAP